MHDEHVRAARAHLLEAQILLGAAFSLCSDSDVSARLRDILEVLSDVDGALTGLHDAPTATGTRVLDALAMETLSLEARAILGLS